MARLFSGIAGFLLSLTPLSIYLMNFGSSKLLSRWKCLVLRIFGLAALLTRCPISCCDVRDLPDWRVLCARRRLPILAGLLEWVSWHIHQRIYRVRVCTYPDASVLIAQVLGNTFPFFVFTTFGGYWVAFAILNDPMVGVAAAYSATGNATEGSANPVFAEGVAVYLVIWGVMVFVYMLGSLRTNVTFVILFFTLDVAFFLLAAGYFRIGEGRDPTSLLKAGGAFAFVTCESGFFSGIRFRRAAERD